MLDAFKKSGVSRQQQADELQTLIAASKEERAALSTMLTQVQLHSAKLASAGKTLQEVEDKAGKTNIGVDLKISTSSSVISATWRDCGSTR